MRAQGRPIPISRPLLQGPQNGAYRQTGRPFRFAVQAVNVAMYLLGAIAALFPTVFGKI